MATPDKPDKPDKPGKPGGRAIVTFGRSYQALAATQSLGRQGIEVIVCDDAPMMTAQFSRYAVGKFIHPAAKDGIDAFLDVMEEQVRKFQPDDERDYVLMPIHEQTRVLSQYRSRFSPYCTVAAPGFEAIEQVDPKHRLMSTASRLDLPIPKTFQIGSGEELEEVLPQLQFPAFLKLPHTSGGIGLHRVESAEELRAAYRETIEEFDVSAEDRQPIVQESAPGEDYCVTMLLEHGEVKASLAYRNVKTYPWSGGSGAIRETVDAEACVDIAAKLLSSLDWHGVAEVDFIWDGEADSQPYLIEVNPRFWGGLFHTIESGIDYPWMLYQMMTTGTVDAAADAIIGTRTQVPMFGVLSAMKDIREDLYDEMKDHCAAGVAQIKEGRVGEGLQRIAHGIDRGIGPSERFRSLQAFLDENKNARTEIFSTEDPQACLGVLFGLAGLLRNGELPEQFRQR